MKPSSRSPFRTFVFAILPCLLGLAVLFGTSGCGQNSDTHEIEQIKIVRGNNQYTLPGKAFQQKLTLVFNGPNVPGMLGGSGNRPPVVNALIHAVPQKDSGLQVEPTDARTDVAGCVSFQVTAGTKVGDQYLRIIPESAPERAFDIRFTVGAAISGGNQEVQTGDIAPQPVTITLVKPDGEPAANVPVYFKIVSSPGSGTSGAEVISAAERTNKDGQASTMVKVGDKAGTYLVGIEVADPQGDYFMRELSVKVMGLDIWKVVINVLGGLALFVFGMKSMSDGLMKIAGDKMKKILHFFSRNGFVAVFAGTAVTAVIQSSSATTVMVIGFINAGLLNLTQAIGIIFGANIGTTVTAQIISFNLGALAMPAIAIGLLGLFHSKRIVRGWGESVFGFGLLFFGMTIMSGELKSLGELLSFQHFFATFDCTPAPGSAMPIGAVLGAILIGTVLTVVVQSSSAAMGIVLALSGGGLINFFTAVPLLLGTNIGTTITAFFASLAANRTAKQAALAHFLFNFIGTFLMMFGFYIPWGTEHLPCYLVFINSITPGDVFAEAPQNIERHIAMAHTMFNVVNTLLLMPFIKPFAKLCEFLIPMTSAKNSNTRLLEPHLLATPTAALEQVVIALRSMLRDSWKMVDAAVNDHFIPLNMDKGKVAELADQEEKIDQLQADITEYLVKIMRKRNLTDHQSEIIPLLMHCTNDAERIADHTANILGLADRLSKSEKKLSGASYKAIDKVWGILNHEAASVIEALGSTDVEKVTVALKSERKINRLTKNFEQENIDRLRKGSCSLVNSVIFIELLGELEKLGDHLSNIAERTPDIQKHYINL